MGGEQKQAVSGSQDGVTPAPSGSLRSSTQVTPGGEVAGSRTDGETIYVLDSQLSSSLSEFDEKMRKEMEALSNSRRSTSTSGDSSGAAGGMGGTASGDEADGQGESASGSTQGEREKGTRQASGSDSGESSESGGETGEATNRTGPGRTGGGLRPKIPDGSDGDIVARQLREAAEAETDPVLKEKLWQEYSNYKKGSS
jgi:hypothetical protein